MNGHEVTVSISTSNREVEVEVNVQYLVFPGEEEAPLLGDKQPQIELIDGLEQNADGQWVHSVLFDALPPAIIAAIEEEIMQVLVL